nr:PREDICTED: uncharacterized protein LOC108203549 [Daucus carota subsp. sativus]
MDLYQIPDLVRCRFPAASLWESAQQWFQNLGEFVISSWVDMQRMFMTQFQAAPKYAPPVTTLANVKQRDNESLTAYFKRFNQESMGVTGASDETFKNFPIAGLKVGTDFWKHLQGKDPSNLSELYAAAESFKKVEQSLAENQKEMAKSRGKRKDHTPSPEPKGRGRSPARIHMASDRRSWSPPRQSAEHIYAVTKDKAPFRKPQPIPYNVARDKKKYCDFHESAGHNTTDCRHLKEEIEELLRAGYLTKWVKKYRMDHPPERRARGMSPEDKDDEKQNDTQFVREGSIRSIFGGPYTGGGSRKAMERYAKEAKDYSLTNVNHLSARAPRAFKGETMDITFTEDDARWVHHPHNDALVVAMRIATMNVHRVFVDNGSSVNILYYDTYKKMGLPDKDMTAENLYVYGFGGEAIKAKGTIRLPVILGEAPRTATQISEFVIIDHPSAHNALMGRPLLKDMKIVTSIYHLTLKFPTPGGVGCVMGSQYESRDCYGRSLKNFQDRRGVPPHEELHSVHAIYFIQYPESDTEGAPSLPLSEGHIHHEVKLPLSDEQKIEQCGEQVMEVEVTPPGKSGS